LLPCAGVCSNASAAWPNGEQEHYMSNERPWLAHYPKDVPAQIDVDTYASVAAVVEEAFGKFRDRPAFASFGKFLSYGEIETLSRQFAGYLTGVLGL
jgi:long-chain acyl-CoA synthetase